jgi:hypothetical protein
VLELTCLEDFSLTMVCPHLVMDLKFLKRQVN